ncbi:MAG: hypothetical protein KC912_05680 [Proteobacteria bacterium]|nr:hypothetical protein [Pseudomonadota bacterium]
MFASDDDPANRRTFAPGVACCTYHPRLANFLVGRQLRKGGEGASRLLERIESGDGVTATGIVPPDGWAQVYAEGRKNGAFGQANFVRCPFLSDSMSCTVWADRGAVCRTWFCAHDDGPRGAALWRTVKAALWEIEGRVARWAIREGSPPEDGASATAWTAWYLWCAEQVDGLAAEAIVDAAVEQLRDDMLAAWSQLDTKLPDVLAASMSQWLVGDRIHVYGYSVYDSASVPASLFTFLSKLDGERPWREALEGSELDEADVAELFRIAALVPPTHAHLCADSELGLRLQTPDGKWVALDPE